MVDHQNPFATCSLFDQPFTLLYRCSQWFFHQNMLPAVQSFHGEVKVGRHRRCNSNSINGRILEQVTMIRGGFDLWITSLHEGKSFRAEVAHGDYPRSGDLGKVAHQIRSPISITNDSDIDHGLLSFCLTSPTILEGTPATIP